MSPQADRSPKEWFEAAERSYGRDHQGCPSCRKTHCVFRSQWGTRAEYYCTACDFSAASDATTGEALYSPGSDPDFAVSLDLLSWARGVGPAPFPADRDVAG
jgi:hypothetical protein